MRVGREPRVTDLKNFGASHLAPGPDDPGTGQDVYWCETDGRAYRYTARATCAQTDPQRV